MEVISIERSTYEELLTSFNSFVAKMKEMANRGKDKGLGEWLDNQDVCHYGRTGVNLGGHDVRVSHKLSSLFSVSCT